MGSVVLPDWHQRAVAGTCVIQGCAVRHPDGVILFDTGVGDDHAMINQWYSPTVVPLIEALNSVGIDERDVVSIVNSHLHFDHCGQNRSLPSVPVWVQGAEYELIDAPSFTVVEWAEVAVDRRRVIDGDATIADGIRIVAAPGHTPGHQVLVIDDPAGVTTLLAGQCCYTCAEFERSDPAAEDAYGERWVDVAQQTLARLHALHPHVVHLSHDSTVLRRTP